ncbi:dephospho-CoA kinase domain-containing protein isoform X2 [Oncorhynchus masou masou]|uniref:dephospho-CoA kinase domain-containing protein isoform X2 n=1 Tax=Oncorhynchus masou masou TaxID=90313 RepID=UPI00318450D2
MFLVGLTGGIASGKSTVSSLLRELGCPIIDADVVARKVVEPHSPAYCRIVKHFGPEILLENGEIDRQKLGQLIFASEDKRRLLNSITHPEIHKAMLKQIFFFFLRGYRYVVLDVPLLFETRRLTRFLNHTVVVYWTVFLKNCVLLHVDFPSHDTLSFVILSIMTTIAARRFGVVRCAQNSGKLNAQPCGAFVAFLNLDQREVQQGQVLFPRDHFLNVKQNLPRTWSP